MLSMWSLHKMLYCISYTVLSYELELIKMRAKLTNLNYCAVPFLSRAAVNLCWYDYIHYTLQFGLIQQILTVPLSCIQYKAAVFI